MSALPRLHIFGTASAHDGRQPLRFADRKGLVLLAVLALEGPTRRAALAPLLWDDSESDIRRNLRRTLHRLREAGFDALLQGDGEVLALKDAVQVDLAAARRWADGHDEPPSTAPELLAGQSFEGAIGAWLMARRDHWSQLWRQAAERQATRLQQAGQTRAALAWALALVHADPLQEGHCVRAMALHAALGEREAALAVYERCRKALGNELGLRPLASTQALAEGLRRGTSAAVPPPAHAPASSTEGRPAWLPAQLPLVGRDGVLHTLRQHLDAGRLVLLQAPAGTGKTRLMSALAESRAGRLCLHECRPGDRHVPFAALVRWLRALAGRAPADSDRLAAATAPAALPAWVRAEVARLLPELGTGAPALDTPLQRLRLFEALREAWQHWHPADAVPAFDDWHFIDDASAEWWLWWRGQGAAAGPASAAVVCQRPALGTPTGARSGAAAVLAQALSELPSSVIELPSLAAEPVLELLGRLSGVSRPVRFATRLWTATGGLPLYLVETLRHLLDTQVIQLDAQGRWSTPFDGATQDYAELPVAPSVQAAVVQRLQSLDEPTRRLLDSAAVADDDFDLDALAATSALDEGAALPALEQAVRARVLARSSSRSGHWRFEHEVVAQALRDALLPERKRLLHRAWAQRLAGVGADAARIAAHFEAASEPPQAHHWHLRALARARERQSRAAQQWHAERLLALGAQGAVQVQAWVVLSQARLVQADATGAAAAMAQAQAALQPGHDAALKADVLCAHAQLSKWRGEASAPLQALLAAEADPALDAEARARLKQARASCLGVLGRYAEAVAALQQALALLGSEPGSLQAQVLDDRARMQLRLGQTDATPAEEALAAAHAADNAALAAQAGITLGIAHLMAGRFEVAVGVLLKARRLAAEEGLVATERGAILNLVSGLLALGRRGEAQAAVDEGYALSRQFTGQSEEQAFLEARYQCRLDTGQLGGARALVPALLAITHQGVDVHRQASALTVVLDLPLCIGDLGTAEPVVAALLALDAHTLSEMDGMAQAKAAWLALLKGEFERAASLLDAAEAARTQRPEAQAYIVALRCQWLAQRGQAQAARQHREALRQEGTSVEVWATALALVLALPGEGAGWEAAAEDTLTHRQPPPLGELLLLDALLQRQGPARWQAAAHRAAAALHRSLAGDAVGQGCFARRFAACLVNTPTGR